MTNGRLRWRRIAQCGTKLYDLPGGPVGRAVVDLLGDEVAKLAAGQTPAGRTVCMAAVIMQRERGVNGRRDVRRIISQRIEQWRSGHFDTLIHEAERQASLPRNSGRTQHQQSEQNLLTRAVGLAKGNRLLEAVRVLEAHGGGIALPSEIMTDKDKTESSVFEILKRKHPNPQEAHTSPAAAHPRRVLITATHISDAGRSLKGGAGPCGMDAFLL
eukprot:GHVN01042840.1.p1 GENE.GHVN01042840.1~~GHVN01042840.1.p1  ORF type:complete len:215 (-),score=33.93 GHVN01042840.1:291-935(-)